MASPETTAAERQRLHGFGWADGGYLCICADCHKRHAAAKRAFRCRSCAATAADEWDTLTVEEKAARIKRNVALIEGAMS